MADLHIHLEIRVTPGIFRWSLAAGLLGLSATELASETVSLTTYYPSPKGVYNQLITTGDTYLAQQTPGKTVIGDSTGLGPPGQVLEVVGRPNVPGPGTTWANLLRLRNSNNDGAGVVLDAANRDWAIVATNPASGFGDQKLVFFDATTGFPNGGRMIIDRYTVAMRRPTGAGACTQFSYARNGSFNQFCPANNYVTLTPGVMNERIELPVIQPPFPPTGTDYMWCCPCLGACPSL